MEKRNFKEITIMNAFLCLSVIMIHLTSSPVASLNYGSFWHILIFIINKSLCFCVPSFIFLSGFKLYNKYQNGKTDVKRFYVSRIKKIVVPYAFCVLVYFLYFWCKKWVSVNELPEFLFLGTLAAHFYYIVIAVQAYFVFPLLKCIFDKAPKLTLICALICSVLCLQFFKFTYSDRFLGTYIFYFVFGVFFAKYEIYKKSNKIFAVGFVGFAVLLIAHITLSYKAFSGNFIYKYAEIVNLLYVAFSIVTMYKIFEKMSQFASVCSIANDLSKVSFSVYLYHILIIFILQYDVFIRFNLSEKYKFLISFAAVYALVFAYSFVMKKIKNKTL